MLPLPMQPLPGCRTRRSARATPANRKLSLQLMHDIVRSQCICRSAAKVHCRLVNDAKPLSGRQQLMKYFASISLSLFRLPIDYSLTEHSDGCVLLALETPEPLRSTRMHFGVRGLTFLAEIRFRCSHRDGLKGLLHQVTPLPRPATALQRDETALPPSERQSSGDLLIVVNEMIRPGRRRPKGQFKELLLLFYEQIHTSPSPRHFSNQMKLP